MRGGGWQREELSVRMWFQFDCLHGVSVMVCGLLLVCQVAMVEMTSVWMLYQGTCVVFEQVVSHQRWGSQCLVQWRGSAPVLSTCVPNE